MNLKELLQLYMRVNDITRADLATTIGIPKSVVRRICEGKQIWSGDMLAVMHWLFGEYGRMSMDEWVQHQREKRAEVANP